MMIMVNTINSIWRIVHMDYKCHAQESTLENLQVSYFNMYAHVQSVTMKKHSSSESITSCALGKKRVRAKEVYWWLYRGET